MLPDSAFVQVIVITVRKKSKAKHEIQHERQANQHCSAVGTCRCIPTHHRLHARRLRASIMLRKVFFRRHGQLQSR